MRVRRGDLYRRSYRNKNLSLDVKIHTHRHRTWHPTSDRIVKLPRTLRVYLRDDRTYAAANKGPWIDTEPHGDVISKVRMDEEHSSNMHFVKHENFKSLWWYYRNACWEFIGCKSLRAKTTNMENWTCVLNWYTNAIIHKTVTRGTTSAMRKKGFGKPKLWHLSYWKWTENWPCKAVEYERSNARTDAEFYCLGGSFAVFDTHCDDALYLKKMWTLADSQDWSRCRYVLPVGDNDRNWCWRRKKDH